jgi:hypothetical protein
MFKYRIKLFILINYGVAMRLYKFLFVACLTTLPITEAVQHQMISEDKFENIWEEVQGTVPTFV